MKYLFRYLDWCAGILLPDHPTEAHLARLSAAVTRSRYSSRCSSARVFCW
jgi:hypothetical protein